MNILSKIFVGLLISFLITPNSYSAPPEEAPKKWPCDQVYNPKLDLNSIWQGPSIEKFIKDWWKDDDIIDYVNQLSNPILSEEDGTRIIEEFSKKYTYFGLIKKSEQREKLILLFAGLYQKARDRRNRQYVGIIKFVNRQESLRSEIGNASKSLRELRKNKIGEEDTRYIDASSKLEWNTRVFDQRTRLTEYICEEPVFNTQRLGYQSRKILSYLN